MLGLSLSSSCMDGEEGMQVATHVAVGWFAAFACTSAKGLGGGGRSLPESLIGDSGLEATHTHI